MYSQTIIGNFLTQDEQAFPHDCELYESLQKNLFRIATLGNIAGDKAILKGCERSKNGNTRSEGLVFLRTNDYPHGEVLYWQGGNILNGMHVETLPVDMTVQGKLFENAYTLRMLKPGRGTEHYDWNDFRELRTLPDLGKQLDDFEIAMSKTIEILTRKDQELSGKDEELEEEISKTNAVINQIKDGTVVAGNASKLETPRTIRLEGDLTGEGTFDGSADLAIRTEGVRAASLTTPRQVKITGVTATSATFDGTKDITLEVQEVPTHLLTGQLAGLTIGEDSLSNHDGKSSISIGNQARSTLAANGTVTIRGNGNNLTCLQIEAGDTTPGKAWALQSQGNHLFAQREGEAWNAPGVLWAGLFTCGEETALIRYWGDGLQIYSHKILAEGVIQVSHSLGHSEYTVVATPYYTSYTTETADYPDQVHLRITNQTPNTFCLRGVDTDYLSKASYQAMVIIVGRNKWE
ncbi:MAG: hypothetical protein LUG98_03860 [Tannerellaceae bacterium]|nr:hypothetical protein [Tannerellaceae bacterium]